MKLFIKGVLFGLLLVSSGLFAEVHAMDNSGDLSSQPRSHPVLDEREWASGEYGACLPRGTFCRKPDEPPDETPCCPPYDCVPLLPISPSLWDYAACLEKYN